MSDHDASAVPSRADYVRKVTIEDGTRIGRDDYPVHVARRVLLDGVEHPGLVNLRLGYAVTGEALGGTVVSMYVDTEQIEHGRIDESSHEGDHFRLTPYYIAGRPCLTPEGRYWETIHIPAPDVTPAAYDSDGIPRQEWTQVHLFVAEVEVVPHRDRPGDVVETTDGQAVVRECSACQGAGHVLASGDPTFEQPIPGGRPCTTCGKYDCAHLVRVLDTDPTA